MNKKLFSNSSVSTDMHASYATFSRGMPWNVPRESLALSLSSARLANSGLRSKRVSVPCSLYFAHYQNSNMVLYIIFFRSIILTLCSFHSFCSFANKSREKTVEERRRWLKVPTYFPAWMPGFFKLSLTRRCVMFVTLLREGLVPTFHGRMYLWQRIQRYGM